MACTLDEHRREVASVLAAGLTRIRSSAEQLAVADPALHGRVTAGPVTARTPIPAFDNSQMDGYALLSSDLAGASGQEPVTLPVGTATAAGDPPSTHVPGTASPVMTGAAMPQGADTVVPIEEAIPAVFPRLARTGLAPEGSVAFTAPSAAGRFVRRRGEDLPEGAEVVGAGTRLTAARIGAIAAAGISHVSVHRRARILLVTTGDEVLQGEEKASAGRIHDTSGPMLTAAVRALGAETEVLHAPDAPKRLLAALRSHAPSVDLVVTMGGISAGAFEVVREALAPLGAEFHGVALQPGGPQGYGLLALVSGDEPTPVLCFPGNPVSSMLSAELFLLPTLRELAGLPGERATVPRILAHDVESPVAKHQLRRGTIDADGRVRVLHPGSHRVSELAGAELLVHLPVGVSTAEEGTTVETWSINDD